MANPTVKKRATAPSGAVSSGETGLTLRFRDDAELGWTTVEGDAPLPAGQNVIVPLGQLANAVQDNAISALAVRLEAGEDARALAPHLARLTMVELVFPHFKDGRSYSAARILRDDLGFTGEIRATGEVLADQLTFMRRCGIDSLVLHPSVSQSAAQAAMARFDAVYQAASDPRTPVWKLRHV